MYAPRKQSSLTIPTQPLQFPFTPGTVSMDLFHMRLSKRVKSVMQCCLSPSKFTKQVFLRSLSPQAVYVTNEPPDNQEKSDASVYKTRVSFSHGLSSLWGSILSTWLCRAQSPRSYCLTCLATHEYCSYI